jgi:two-component system NarL family response regulator
MSDVKPPIRVLCVDDHRIVLEAIARLIDEEPDIETVGMAVSGREAVALFRALRPHVTLMDLQLPDLSGVDAIRMIRQVDPEALIIVLTMYQGDEDIYRAFQAGAATYLLKDILADELVGAIREVHSGKRPIGAKVEARLIERSAREALTRRERDHRTYLTGTTKQGDRRVTWYQRRNGQSSREEHSRQARS